MINGGTVLFDQALKCTEMDEMIRLGGGPRPRLESTVLFVKIRERVYLGVCAVVCPGLSLEQKGTALNECKLR